MNTKDEAESIDVEDWLNTAVQYVNAVLRSYLCKDAEAIPNNPFTKQMIFALPDEKPANVNSTIWNRAKIAQAALCKLDCINLELEHGELRFALGHAIEFGNLLHAWHIEPLEKFIVNGISNTKKLTTPQKQKRLAGLASVVQSLPQVKWMKTTTGVEMIVRLTGIKSRTVWEYLPVLRSADEQLITKLAEITSLSDREIRKRISRIPAGK